MNTRKVATDIQRHVQILKVKKKLLGPFVDIPFSHKKQPFAQILFFCWLILAGANARARRFLPAVRVPYRQHIRNSAKGGEAIAAQEEAVSLMIEGRVGGDEGKGGNDGANISEADHPAGADATLQVAA